MGLWTEERRRQKKAKKEAEVVDSERQNVTRTLMSTMAGREFVYNILEGCGMFFQAFTPNALAMAYDEGKREIGFRFLKDINDKCPEYYVQMMKEHNERSANNSNRTGSNDNTTGTGFAGPSSEYPRGTDAGGADQGGNGTADPNAPDPHGYYDRTED